MDAKYTPGPWKFLKEFGRVETESAVIAYVAGGVKPEFEIAFANGRLIAAAPEMVTALEHAIAIFLEDETLGNSVDYNDVRSQIAEALRKARGF